MDSIPVSAIEQGGTAPTQTAFPFFNPKSSRMDSSITPLSSQVESKLVLKNKSPRWHEHLRCWCLNFHGRVTVASVKNFQLVASDESAPANEENDDTTLQFGKIGKDLFTLDYRYPVSAFQAFAICLSSFDTKLAREWRGASLSFLFVSCLLTCQSNEQFDDESYVNGTSGSWSHAYPSCFELLETFRHKKS